MRSRAPRLGDYLRDLSKLYDEFGYSGSALYGYFGQGCVHTRIPFDLVTAEGIATFRRFIERAADLVVSYGGSFSGEHGDGQSRGELLPKMFGDDLVRAFGQFKAIFDPDNLMNPGKVVAPYRIDENLRLGTSWTPRDYDSYFSYPDDDGRFERAVMRCVGVGKCRHSQGGVMCPSYMVTREEEHSTRDRSRLLFEMLEGHADSPIEAGWRSTEVRDALDLCLACKSCKKDCPAEVDMATMKAEFLAHHYAGRLRPRAHYSMGWLPAVAQVASRAPRLVNAVTQAPVLRDVLTAAGCCARPTSTWTYWTRAAAGWPATSASRPGTMTCPGPAASGSCCPPCATRPRTPWCWRTASAAAPRSSRATPDAPRCTWPKSWPPACEASPCGRPVPRSRLPPTTPGSPRSRQASPAWEPVSAWP